MQILPSKHPDNSGDGPKFKVVEPTVAQLMANGGRLLVITILREMPYSEYLLTNHWQTVRLATLKRARYQCRICLKSVSLDAHHICYDNLGDERPEDTIALCRGCHNLQHETIKAVMAAQLNQSLNAPEKKGGSDGMA